MRALKDFLNKRAAGMVQFFLSSDDESIRPGTLWSNEVKEALDRMKLILIFASKEAMESPWTFFEAGYGLAMTTKASVYCLHGCSKESLVSPFSLLQNRNLHSAANLSLLIKHCNEELGSTMDEEVTKTEFEKIFAPRLKPKKSNVPPFEKLVESIEIYCTASCDAAQAFREACEVSGHQAVEVTNWEFYDVKENPSLASVRADLKKLESKVAEESMAGQGIYLKIKGHTEYRKAEWPDWISTSSSVATIIPREWAKFLDAAPDAQKVLRNYDKLRSEANFARLDRDHDCCEYSGKKVEFLRKIVEDYNLSLPELNMAAAKGPRDCQFRLEPIAYQAAVDTLHTWMEKCQVPPDHLLIRMKFRGQIFRELRPEKIFAMIKGTELNLTKGGQLSWRGGFDIFLDEEHMDDGGPAKILVTGLEVATRLNLHDFDLPGLVKVLFEGELLHRR